MIKTQPQPAKPLLPDWAEMKFNPTSSRREFTHTKQKLTLFYKTTAAWKIRHLADMRKSGFGWNLIYKRPYVPVRGGQVSSHAMERICQVRVVDMLHFRSSFPLLVIACRTVH
ncbi:hypothetical protein BaRGS_00031108 [Batillaria attramentaria]|uniref:Uncharacterized protein n=1 Tax=Batillaria attramentaria TaxID=370345 RepID=A0ABD0JSH3_9CAEN